MPYDPERHGPQRIIGPGFHARVHALVSGVPAGALTTYGDLAAALGRKGVARQVGWALAALPAGSPVPWWRVVMAHGTISRAGTASARRQRALLQRDGVRVVRGRVVDFAERRHAFGGGLRGSPRQRGAVRKP
ncbi:MAG TPA: MGMT family protein [Planctomycetota bacterium]|nr:MGMT family protein [Planctomycetota bacterium]